jgi:hypothetical protein
MSAARFREPGRIVSLNTALTFPRVTGGGLVEFTGAHWIGGKPKPAKPLESDWEVSSPNYFATLRVPLLRGRDFSAGDPGTWRAAWLAAIAPARPNPE